MSTPVLIASAHSNISEQPHVLETMEVWEGIDLGSNDPGVVSASDIFLHPIKLSSKLEALIYGNRILVVLLRKAKV